ncbi:MAG: D-alanyl-D-alanine carboxypeptidase family protein [Candidatus Thiodiazotropha sp.]
MMTLTQAVGKGCPNRPADVKSLHQRLMDIGMIPCYVSQGSMDDKILKGIIEVQTHFMRNPDGVISVNRTTHRFLNTWSIKKVSPGVQLPGKLLTAWDLVNPLLPKGSYCTSGYRSAEHQRRILHRFYKTKYKSTIIAKYGKTKYDAALADMLAHEDEILSMVRGVGQAIAKPGRSAHQRGKAIDVGGPSTIDNQQVKVIKLVARAHPSLLSGKVIKERNGCVHFEIR